MIQPFPSLRDAMKPLVPCALLLLLSGCGLSDYERRMDQVRRKLARQDEEDRLLGTVAVAPVRVDAKEGIAESVWPFEIFLRLPQGYSGTGPDKDGSFPGPDLTLYRYEGKNRREIFLAAAEITPAGSKPPAEELGRSFTTVEFRRQTLQALRNYYWQYLWGKKFVIDFKEAPSEKRVIPVLRTGSTLSYDWLEIDDDPRVAADRAVHFHVYFHQEGDRQVAAVFQVPRDKKDDSADSSMRIASLGTLALGDEARKRAVEWRRRKP